MALLALPLGAAAVAEASDSDPGLPASRGLFARYTVGLTDAKDAIVSESSTLAQSSACDVRRGRRSYSWPVKPFESPHPVRGNFGDPRTILFSSTDPTEGAFSFHNGIDIAARPGTPVYSVLSGIVRLVSPDSITVDASGVRVFLYFHLEPVVHEGERVRARRTVLGYVHAPYDHVHLSEIDDGIVRNPLAPGHLMPYRDRTAPVVHGIAFRDASGQPLRPNALVGAVDLVAWADDRPALEPSGAWRNVPVSPAVVSWELTRPSGVTVVPEQVAVDFLRTEPPRGDFWDVYVPGTYQNFPVVGDTYAWGLPGRYLFDLTPALLDTTRIPPGSYLVTVRAKDTCGNVNSLTERVRILDQDESAPSQKRPNVTGAGAPVWPSVLSLAVWPHRHRAWTVVLALLPEGQGLDAALGRARDALAAGVTRVGLLWSDEVANLRPGFVLVFSGYYRTEHEAKGAALAVLEDFPGAYPFLVVRHAHDHDAVLVRARRH